MDSWETSGKAAVGKAQWEGEDEEDDVLDSWDQEEAVEQPQQDNKPAPASTADKKKNKRREETPSKDAKSIADMTPEELLADKLYRQKLQEESDLVLAKEIFGVSNGALETKEEFDKLHSDISTFINNCVKNNEFTSFAEQVVQTLCLHLNSTDLKKIHNTVGNLHIEKLKLEKGDKAKKKSKNKAKLRMEGDTDYNEFSAYTTDDFDDFI